MSRNAPLTLGLAAVFLTAGAALARADEAPAEPPDYRSLVLLPLVGELDEPGALAALDEAVQAEFQKAGAFDLLRPADLEVLAESAGTQSSFGCFEEAQCLAELVGQLRSDLVAHGQVKRVGELFSLSLRVVARVEVETLATASASAAESTELVAEVPAMVATLVEKLGGGSGSLPLPLESLGAEPRFAVMDLAPQGLDDSVGEGLSDALVAELSLFEGVKVFSRADIAAMLTAEEYKRALGCDDTSCIAEIGGALGAAYIVTGSVTALGAALFVNVRIVDTRTVDVVAFDAERLEGPVEELLVGMRFLVRRLLGSPYEGHGQLRVRAQELEATLTVDGELAGQVPDLSLPPRLTAGKHRLELSKEGFYPLTRETYVEPARVTTVDLEMTPLPTPWYRSWWFWTIVGTVAVGTTTAAVIATQVDTSPSTGGGNVSLGSLEVAR